VSADIDEVRWISSSSTTSTLWRADIATHGSSCVDAIGDAHFRQQQLDAKQASPPDLAVTVMLPPMTLIKSLVMVRPARCRGFLSVGGAGVLERLEDPIEIVGVDADASILNLELATR